VGSKSGASRRNLAWRSPAAAREDGACHALSGAVLFPGFELLDVFGPLEAFANHARPRATIAAS
jgi:hypothetical protein